MLYLKEVVLQSLMLPTVHGIILYEKLFGKIPAQFIWFIVLTALMQWVYRYHKFGNHIHFVGDNKASDDNKC